MEKISLLINATKDFEFNDFKQKLELLEFYEYTEPLFIQFENKNNQDFGGFQVFSVDNHDDVSFSQLINKIPNKHFLFFDTIIDYPKDFFKQLLRKEEKPKEKEKRSLWQESVVALQQSPYGLLEQKKEASNDLSYLLPSVLFSKKDIATLNTDKLYVHQDSAVEIFRYAQKKKLAWLNYAPIKESPNYILHLRELMVIYKDKAQKEFKIFPAFFIVFFVFFGLGAAFHPLFMLIFLVGMGGYFMAITLEAFGTSSIKQNGGLVPVLLVLFPLIHLVYGLESWMTKFKK